MVAIVGLDRHNLRAIQDAPEVPNFSRQMACVLVAIGIRVRQPDSDRKSIMRTEHCGVYPRVVTPTLYLLVSWYALLPLSVPAADKAAPKLSTATIKSIRRAVKSTMAQQQVVGVAVGVIRAGSVVYPRGWAV